jgi:Domain of unknown function (DUF4263)
LDDLDTSLVASARALRRTVANSGKVAYGDAVIIHDTLAKHIQIVPFYVPRSTGTELHAKIEYWRKSFGITIGPVRELSLNAADCLALYRMLGDHLEISRQDGGGKYVVLRLDDGAVDLTSADPLEIAGSLVGILSTPDIAKYLTTRELGSELLLGLRSIIRYQELKSAVDELRSNLDSGVTDERTYQAWCDQHSWAFGNAYLANDAVRSIAVGDQVDALLPSVSSGLRDIIELKRPDMSVLHWDNTHKNHYFTQDVSKAIGQSHRYLDVLHEEAARGLRDHPEVVAYHPRATIVIGRSRDWGEDRQKALHGLNARLNGISVMTYDHLLAQCENALQMLGPSSPVDDGEEGFAGRDGEYESEPPWAVITQEPVDYDEEEEEEEEEISEEEVADFYNEMYAYTDPDF